MAAFGQNRSLRVAVFWRLLTSELNLKGLTKRETTMRKIFASIATATLLLLSTSVSADIAQVWQCQIEGDATNDEFMALSKSWLDAAKEINDSASVRVYVPVAAAAETGSYIFALYLPDFKSWGEFNDAYPDSPLAKVDERWTNELGPCDVPGLWSTLDFE
jgi:hypothetical protein